MSTDVTGGVTVDRLRKALATYEKLSDFGRMTCRIIEYRYEKTGRRFGQVHGHSGRAEKIGGGGRNRGSDYAYQVWMIWE